MKTAVTDFPSLSFQVVALHLRSSLLEGHGVITTTGNKAHERKGMSTISFVRHGLYRLHACCTKMDHEKHR